jgi:hypothetical protein
VPLSIGNNFFNLTVKLVFVTDMALLEKLGNRQISKAELFEFAHADSTLIPTLIEGTSSPKATIRYGCSSVLSDLSQQCPDKLYSYFDNFAVLRQVATKKGGSIAMLYFSLCSLGSEEDNLRLLPTGSKLCLCTMSLYARGFHPGSHNSH